MSDETGGVRVRTFPGLCNGVGNCHRWAPRVYSLDRDGLIAIHLVDVPPGCIFAARCPSVMPRCRVERPPLIEVAAGHRSACWLA